MPETDNTPENNNEAEQKSENVSTDDYFENVNKRLKKKSRFSFDRSSKKTPAPEPKVESPPEPAPGEAKVEPPAPIVEAHPEPEKVEVASQAPSVEQEPVKVEEPIKAEEPTVDVVEQQPSVAEETALVVAESESKSQVVEEVKPKKKGFFSFLHRKPKEPIIEKTPLVEPSKEVPSVEVAPVEQPLPVEVTEPQSPMEQVEEAPPVWPPVEPVPAPVVVEAPSKPVAIEQVKPKKRGFFSFLHRKPKEPIAEKLTAPEVEVEAPSIEGGQPAPVAENLVVTPEVAVAETPVVSEDTVDISQVNTQTPFFDGVVNIGKFTKEVKAGVPTKAVLSIGEYPIHLLLKSRFASKPEGVLPLFIDKSSHDIVKWSQDQLNPEHIIGLDSDLDTHFWYNITPNMTSEGVFISRLKNKLVEQLHDAIFVASIWDGVGSALLPALMSQFNEWKINSVAVVLMPSKIQSTENQFNAFAALGKCSLLPSAPLVLVDRDNMENYIGVDRRGNMINGNAIANYLVDFMLSKESLVGELSELSKTFDSKLFTLMFATGASLKVYGSIENMLDTVLFKPFLSFDLSSTSLLYVLARVPYHLKEKITRGKVEMAVANWFKDKSTLQSIHVGEPVYVEDSSDRIDIALFIGGFETAKMFAAVEKRVNTLKNRAVKNGFLQEDEWKEIVKKLVD
jgi:hypothetical protein